MILTQESCPENSTKELPEHIRLYAESRALPADKLMYSSSKAAGMHNRVIVPSKWKRKTIGFSARSVDNDTQNPNTLLVMIVVLFMALIISCLTVGL